MSDDIDDATLRAVAAAVQRQIDIDKAEAGPKAPFARLMQRGVRLESRWQVMSEFTRMQRAIDAMPELIVRRLGSVWCDSHAGSNYIVGVRPGLFAPELPRAIDTAFLESTGGHSGIMLEDAGSGDTLEFVEPFWIGDDDC